MTRRATAMALLVLAALVPAWARAQDWPTMSPPRPLLARHVDFPSYRLKTLANGLQVLVVPFHEQPSLTFRLLVRAGAVQEPPDHPGVASLVAELLDQGTTSRSAEDIATEIDSVGGVLTAGSGNEMTYLNGAVVKDQVDAVLALASDVIQHPAFSPEELDLRRRQMLSSLQVAYDDPDYIADLVFDRLVFGDHPYGRPNEGTAASIARITRADLVAFHRQWFVPNNTLLAIVGDISADAGLAAAEKAFGAWTRGEVPSVTPPTPPPPARRVVVIDRPGSAQTEIRAGNLAIPHNHEDYLALDLATRILGGEGANRLFGVLRSERGLTYGAEASFRAFKTAGEIVAQTNTRTPGTAESLRVMVDEIARMQRERVHPAELTGAQDFISGHFPLSIEAPSAIAEQVLGRLFFGQSLSDIDTYLDRVNAIEPADVQRVSRQWMRPDALTIVLVGDASAFVDDLARMGFAEFERIPLVDLDMDAPTLRRSAAAALRPLPRN